MANPQALPDLIERLKMEAQIHAQEARTANATIAEIYRIVSGGTGEPGNWHGAEPVRKCIEELRARATTAAPVGRQFVSIQPTEAKPHLAAPCWGCGASDCAGDCTEPQQ